MGVCGQSTQTLEGKKWKKAKRLAEAAFLDILRGVAILSYRRLNILRGRGKFREGGGGYQSFLELGRRVKRISA